jgi:hypothetical protein
MNLQKVLKTIKLSKIINFPFGVVGSYLLYPLITFEFLILCAMFKICFSKSD